MTIIKFPSSDDQLPSDPLADAREEARQEEDRRRARAEWDRWTEEWAAARGLAVRRTPAADARLVVPCRYGELCIVAPGRLCFRLHDSGQCGQIVATIKGLPLVAHHQNATSFVAMWNDTRHPSLVSLLDFLQPRRVVRPGGSGQ